MSEEILISQLKSRIRDLELQLQEISLHTHILLDIAKALNASLDTNIIASNIISAMVSLISINKASVLLWDENEQSFDPIGIFDSATLNPKLPPHLDLAFAQKILHSGTVFHKPPQNSNSQEWDWLCCMPMQNAQRKIGTINIHAIRQPEITASQMEFLETVASHAASALENAILYNIVQRESITDGLTGVYNHRYFHKRLREYISLSQRRKQNSFGILIIDVDYFKNFNDRYGHQFGDLVLKTVVHTLARNLRTEDLLARYGGEEFVLLVPSATEKVVQVMSEKIRNIVEQTKIHNLETNQKVSVTVSIGATIWHPSDNSASVISRADTALYQAKDMGRNQSVIL